MKKCNQCGGKLIRQYCEYCKNHPDNLPKKYKSCFILRCEKCGFEPTDYHHDR